MIIEQQTIKEYEKNVKHKKDYERLGIAYITSAKSQACRTSLLVGGTDTEIRGSPFDGQCSACNCILFKREIICTFKYNQIISLVQAEKH
jgi:hypothetical protein